MDWYVTAAGALVKAGEGTSRGNSHHYHFRFWHKADIQASSGNVRHWG
jgi:hypothetical protein